MITEDYVSYETAKLLKEKGFDENTSVNYFVGDDKPRGCVVGEMIYHKRIEEDTHLISCPTLQMARKWLREVHHLTIDIFHFRDWKVNIKTIPDDYFKADYSYQELKPAETYEEACEAAIKYCLENLI